MKKSIIRIDIDFLAHGVYAVLKLYNFLISMDLFVSFPNLPDDLLSSTCAKHVHICVSVYVFVYGFILRESIASF